MLQVRGRRHQGGAATMTVTVESSALRPAAPARARALGAIETRQAFKPLRSRAARSAAAGPTGTASTRRSACRTRWRPADSQTGRGRAARRAQRAFASRRVVEDGVDDLAVARAGAVPSRASSSTRVPAAQRELARKARRRRRRRRRRVDSPRGCTVARAPARIKRQHRQQQASRRPADEVAPPPRPHGCARGGGMPSR